MRTKKRKVKGKISHRIKANVKRCTCPFDNPKGHWEDRDCDGYDDTWVEAKV